eukprot:gene6541-8987_t
MGGGASNASVFDYQYHKERSELRKALMMSFIEGSENKDILEKIALIRSIIIQHPHICATAAKESENKIDYTPTSSESALYELNRIYTIYETHTILKSVQCRIGPVACPIGHYAPYFEIASNTNNSNAAFFSNLFFNNNNDLPKCAICSKLANSGYQCSYCSYTVCVPCSVIYCSNGHAMKLWTHAESQHTCSLCKKQPVTSGYRCLQCVDETDFCDYCTYKEGRKMVQDEILARVAVDLQYMIDHQDESETAKKTVKEHRKKMKNNLYPTTLALYEFSMSLHDIQVICVAEVRQTRITREILRLRAILKEGIEFCATAKREALITENYTAQEMERLTILVSSSDLAKSVLIRNSSIVACPLGHAAIHFIGKPQQYIRRDNGVSGSNRKVVCKVCDRVALEGHPMVLWTVPEAAVSCYLCSKEPISRGYHCSYCNHDMCDMCTTKAGRGSVRNAWDAEMNELIEFLQENKKYSDQALYYHWRHKNYVVSVGNLVDYVKELRIAKQRTIKQVQQKPIIDKIKDLRGIISLHTEICMTAKRESERSKDYIYSSKRAANQELDRLQAIIDESDHMKTLASRAKASVACPLGHGMIFIKELPLDLQAVSPEYITFLENKSKHFSSMSNNNESIAGSSGLKMPADMMAGTYDDLSSINLMSKSNNEMIQNENHVDHNNMQSYSFDSTIVSMEDNIKSANQGRKEGNNESVIILEKQNSNDYLSNISLFDNNKLVSFDSNNNNSSISIIEAFQQNNKEKKIDITSVEAYLDDESHLVEAELRARNKYLYHLCHMCNRHCGVETGKTCRICEYDLCEDCSIMYCRLGHKLKIWTMPDANSLFCDMCKTPNITSGYRCMECIIDICDFCTTKDCRNAFTLWPRKQIKILLNEIEDMQLKSIIAKNYLQQYGGNSFIAKEKISLLAAPLLCKKLNEIQNIRQECEKEIKQNNS